MHGLAAGPERAAARDNLIVALEAEDLLRELGASSTGLL
jgi:hypothetical protein